MAYRLSNAISDLSFAEALRWLLERGYWIFPAFSYYGPVDVIAMDPDGKIILIDVRTMNSSFGGSCRPLSEEQKRLGVKLLRVRNGRCEGFREEEIQEEFHLSPMVGNDDSVGESNNA